MERKEIYKFASLLAFLAVGIAGHADKLPDGWLLDHKGWFEFAGLVGSIVQAWFMRAPSGTASVALPIAFVLGMGGVVGCGGKGAPNTTPQTSEQKAAHVLDVVRRVGVVVEQTQIWEIEVYKSGLVKGLTADVHVKIQTGFGVAATSVLAALEKLPDILTAEGRRDLILKVSDAVLLLVDRLNLIADDSVRRMALVLDTAKILLAEVLP